MAKTILIADDDSTVVKLFHLDMETKNVDIVVRSTDSGESTIEAIEEATPDLVILDIRMPKGDGFSVLDHLKKAKKDIPVVILTNYRSDDYIAKSKRYTNVKEYIVKHETRMDRVIDAVHAHLG